MNTSKNRKKTILLLTAFILVILTNVLVYAETNNDCEDSKVVLNSIYSKINSGTDFYTLNQAKIGAFCNSNDLLLAGAGTLAQCDNATTSACNYNTNYEFNGPTFSDSSSTNQGWQSLYSAEGQDRFYDTVREEAICLPKGNASKYFSIYIRTAGSGSNQYALDQSNTIAVCDAGDKVISGGGYAPYCDADNPACGKKQYLEFNGPVTIGSQEGWKVNYDLGGNSIYDTVETFAVCLKKTSLFDDNFKIYKVVNQGSDADNHNQGSGAYALDQSRTAAFCNSGDIAIGGGGNAPPCDYAGDPACGRTQYLEFNGKITAGNQQGWQTFFDLTGNAIYDTQRTSVICLGLSNSCNNQTIICNSNSDCGTNGFVDNPFCSNNDLFQNYITYTCVNPGQTNSYCSNSTCNQFKQDCGENNSCTNYSSNYCKDNNVYKSRFCNDNGCSEGSCYSTDLIVDEVLVETCQNGCTNGTCNPVNTCYDNSDCEIDEFCEFNTGVCHGPGICLKVPDICPLCNQYSLCYDPVCGCDNVTYVNDCDRKFEKVSKSHDGECTAINCSSNSDCGTNGFVDNPFCTEDDLFQNFITYTCNNPGQTNSSCTNSTASQLKKDCGDSSCENYGANYCKNNNIYKSRTCIDKGCSNNSCFSTNSTQEVLVQKCSYKCENSVCIEVHVINPCDIPNNPDCPKEEKPPITQYQDISFAFINETLQKLQKNKVKCNYFICNSNWNTTGLWILIIIFLLLLIILVIAFILWLLDARKRKQRNQIKK